MYSRKNLWAHMSQKTWAQMSHFCAGGDEPKMWAQMSPLPWEMGALRCSAGRKRAEASLKAKSSSYPKLAPCNVAGRREGTLLFDMEFTRLLEKAGFPGHCGGEIFPGELQGNFLNRPAIPELAQRP